jgi:hypothetical protein
MPRWSEAKASLASISVSFPNGAVMLLQIGGENVRFKPRPLAGTNERCATPDRAWGSK